MANYIITKNKKFFDNIGSYNFCDIDVLKHLPETIAFDSETTGLFSIIDDMFCCQIGTGMDNYIIHMYDDNYTFHDVIPYIKEKTLIMQNALFDLGFMYKYKFVPKKVWDTFLASRILHNGEYNVRHDFGSLMQRHLGVYYDKTDQKNIAWVKLSQTSSIKYSFNDVDKLIKLHDVILEKIKDGGFLLTYRLHCRFIKALAYMERCGLPINPKAWMKKMEVDYANTTKYKAEVVEYIYDNLPKYADMQLNLFGDTTKKLWLNLKSPAQMIPVFQDLEINTKNKDGKDSIEESIITKSKHEFVPIWLKYQEAQHRVSTFGRKVYDKIRDGRIYTNFNPMVDTSRLASRRGHINFLNFPADKETRHCFEASKGNKMIVCDWGGQETVIAADLSGDAAMTKVVVEERDLHSVTTRALYPHLAEFDDETIMTKYAKERQSAKAPRFAMQYGGNAYTLHVNENIPLREAEEIYAKFIALHIGLFNWGEKKFLESVKAGNILSVDGWRLKLPKFDRYKELEEEINNITKGQWALYRIGKAERKREIMIDKANKKREKDQPIKVFKVVNEAAYTFYRQKRKPISDYFSLRSEYKRLALNNPVQTRGAHQMKLALSMMFEWIVEKGYMDVVLMCNAVHDETVAEAPEELAEEVRDAVQNIMREAGNYYLTDLKIKADAAIGQTWYEAK